MSHLSEFLREREKVIPLHVDSAEDKSEEIKEPAQQRRPQNGHHDDITQLVEVNQLGITSREEHDA
jgi:hypothetical protein